MVLLQQAHAPPTSLAPVPPTTQVLDPLPFPVQPHPSYAAANANVHGNSLVPCLKNLSSASSSKLPHLYIHGGSVSAPVTPPPLSSPTARTPRINAGWLAGKTILSTQAGVGSSACHLQLHQVLAVKLFLNQNGLLGFECHKVVRPSSPTFSLVASSPFGFKEEALAGGGSRMWTPGQSGTCSPAIAAGSDHTADVPMAEVIPYEFAFRCSNAIGLVKPWEGDRIHEESGSDDLELTLGNSRTR
ncbi:hypothetical protein OIU84_002889 [Salix udensis]|uniref:Protein BZR1 homolog n=1 Tax=Salix udensis TaxID=889485 RepID=A0AAD6K576_9ROSI|nr:hypothetical protein OIU84_002889 [Salix udensis]